MKKGIPKPFTIEDICLRPCFTAPSYRIFVALVIGWVLTTGTHTISHVILTMGLHESRHFATIYRFLGKGQWCTDRISYCLFRMMVGTLIAEGVEIRTVGDDTLNSTAAQISAELDGSMTVRLRRTARTGRKRATGSVSSSSVW